MRWLVLTTLTAAAASVLCSTAASNPPVAVPYQPVKVVAPVMAVQPVVIQQPVYVKIAEPVVRFSFVAAPTTPAPVLLAAPMPPPKCCNLPTAPLMTDQQVRFLAWEMAKHMTPMTTGTPLTGRTIEESPSVLPPKALGLPVGEETRMNRANGAREALLTALPVMARHCTACHTGAGARDNIQLFNSRGEFAPNVTAEEIWSVMRPRGNRAARMPKGQVTQPDPHELNLVRRWKEASE